MPRTSKWQAQHVTCQAGVDAVKRDPTAEIERLRPALAEIVGAFTSGIYCAACGESLDDGCLDDCVIGKGRRALTGEPEILGGR